LLILFIKYTDILYPNDNKISRHYVKLNTNGKLKVVMRVKALVRLKYLVDDCLDIILRVNFKFN